MSKQCFGIGIYKPKFEYNVGTLFRTAYQLGASFVFTVSGKYNVHTADTYKCHKNIPVFQFGSFAEMRKCLYNMPIVAIEFDRKDSILLKEYKHRKRCVYLLGREDIGIPRKIVNDCKECVYLDSVRQPSFNVNMSGGIVMYDRLQKL